MLEGISITFNVDVAELQTLDIDPTTSEGKATLRATIIDALQDLLDASPRNQDTVELDGICKAFLKDQ